MVELSALKLGRKAVKWDSRTLRLASYLGNLPPAPTSVDWSKGITDWGMMLNDQLGDCTVAGAAHAIQVWSANLGQVQTVNNQDVLAAYEAWDGYVVGQPDTDQGGIELDVLTKWKASGLAGHRLLAFASIAAIGGLVEVRQAIHLFGGAYIGLGLPATAQSQDVWDLVPNGGDDARDGSWGGHCVYVVGYDPTGFTCITWGQLKKMTTRFWLNYCDEAYALLGADWIGAKGSPEGFNLEQLQTDLAQIR